MRSANTRSIAEFCARQYEMCSCALMRGIDLKGPARRWFLSQGNT